MTLVRGRNVKALNMGERNLHSHIPFVCYDFSKRLKACMENCYEYPNYVMKI
jgi:hypothetical protein